MKNKIVFIALILIVLSFILPSSSLIGVDSSSIDDVEYWALLVSVAVYADDPSQNRPLMLEEVDGFYE